MSTLKVDTIQDISSNEIGMCRIWWFYNQATPTVDDSLNVSSITDSATGRHTINYSVTMSAATYSAAGAASSTNSAAADRNYWMGTVGTLKTTTASEWLQCSNAGAIDLSAGGTIWGYV